MDLVIETKDYEMTFGTQIACYVSNVLFDFWKRDFTMGDTLFIDRKMMKRISEYCRVDGCTYFDSRSYDYCYLMESFEKILLLMNKKEKAVFKFY